MLRKIHIILGLGAFLLFLGTGVDIAYAQDSGLQQSFDTATDILSKFIIGMEILAHMFFNVLKFLIDPRTILGITYNTGDTNPLNQVWIVSRNIMNVLFAFMLVVGAVMTVVTAKKDTIQPYIAKFVLAVILVNFSWLFPRVILDVANVTTATIYQLPDLIITDQTCEVVAKIVNDEGVEEENIEQCQIIDKVYLFESTDTVDEDAPGIECPISGVLCYKLRPFFGSDNSTPHGILTGLVMNHGRLLKLTEIVKQDVDALGEDPDAIEVVKVLVMFFVRSVVVMALMIMFLFPLAAMVIAFVVRIPIIWVTIAFMPFMFLGFIVGSTGKFNTMEILKKFTVSAFLPAVVAIPLVIGYIMIDAITSIPVPPTMRELAEGNPIVSGIPSLWTLLWTCVAGYVVWQGFFTALAIDETYQKISDGVKSVGERYGKFGLQAPLAATVVPGTKGPDGKGGLSLLQAKNLLANPNTAISGGQLKDLGEIFNQGSKNNPTTQDAIRASDGKEQNIRNKLNIQVSNFTENTNRYENKLAGNDESTFRTDVLAVESAVKDLGSEYKDFKFEDGKQFAEYLKKIGVTTDQKRLDDLKDRFDELRKTTSE